ncbi:MAG: macrolide ABC transporter ATP-binding protein [Thermoprotei archaeon]|nr:MAG: macrolide ABC transporter ATP-binding protein [Thermoprotei archaeon]
MPIIVVEDVWKIYRSGRFEYPALKGVSFSVDEGEFVAVVGPSGSGKTTLLNIIGGLDKPTKGTVYVAGVEVPRLSSKELSVFRNRTIGFVFQTFNLVPYLSVVENVELPAAIAGVPRRIRRERALKLLEIVGLGDKAHKRATELSSGEQQRVAIARALMNDPPIILADEPTGNLDVKNTEIVVSLFRRLCDDLGKTIVMVTHNLELIRFCDRVIKLRDGKVIGIEVVRR